MYEVALFIVGERVKVAWPDAGFAAGVEVLAQFAGLTVPGAQLPVLRPESEGIRGTDEVVAHADGVAHFVDDNSMWARRAIYLAIPAARAY